MQATEIAPFPYPLGLGTDICHIPRIRRILANEKPQYAEQFAQKIFGPAERGEFNSRYQKLLQCKRDGLETVPASAIDSLVRDKYDQKLWQLSSWVAGRFAAKEAAIKAVSPRRLKWHQAEVVVRAGQMKPLLVIHDAQSIQADGSATDGRSVRKRAAQLSISHDGEYAIATVLAVNDAPVS
ncbi:hypothetical protein ASPVEDRAFT_32236 [Aspergillus versicolor CBS 583.65]|uniref:4'-phosphopantetheinyl transferase domain-containing protein n=1 Tax=Aspergillus versicolor CBS 583.65 TaxID=1036611 RepID=A0A1L9PWS9_ASPVE|nr:uncharacterized protein ASPVEDRAFT_32236 [Aspergillus versicolor CBS 583.65]OJJ05892.1 hypothetical protein ASPVEDRAFT_32236 [Aspergillus versicolor CBS 583.65]